MPQDSLPIPWSSLAVEGPHLFLYVFTENFAGYDISDMYS